MTRDELNAVRDALLRRDHAAYELATARRDHKSAQDMYERAQAEFEEINSTVLALCKRVGMEPGEPIALPRFGQVDLGSNQAADTQSRGMVR